MVSRPQLFTSEGAQPSGAPSGEAELLLAAVVDQVEIAAICYTPGMEDYILAKALMFAAVPLGLLIVAFIIAYAIRRFIPDGPTKDELYRR